MTYPDIKPEYRTSTVVDLCRAIREAQTFEALPILADAIQEAGCEDETLLAALRVENQDYVEGSRLVALIMSDETAAAVAWIDKLTRELGDVREYLEGDDDEATGKIREVMNFNVLMDAAKDWVENDGELHGSMQWSSRMRGRYDEFWENYQLVTGKAVDFDQYGRSKYFVRCGC